MNLLHPHYHFVHRPESLKTFQAFPLLLSSSRQFEEGFLNDPLIIGSGVTLVFQPCLLAFLLPRFPSPPLFFISPSFIWGLFLLNSPSPPPTSHLSLQNGFLVRLFVLMKWNAAKSLRAFFFFLSNLESHRVWVDMAEWELSLSHPHPPSSTHNTPHDIHNSPCAHTWCWPWQQWCFPLKEKELGNMWRWYVVLIQSAGVLWNRRPSIESE